MTQTPLKRQWQRYKLAGLALGQIFLVSLTACNAPNSSTMVVFNISGQSFTIKDCEDNVIEVPNGDHVDLHDEYAAFGGGTRQWDCFQRRVFVISAADGSRWSYRLWTHRDLQRSLGSTAMSILSPGGSIPDHPSLRTMRSHPIRTFIPVAIDAEGQILAGRWVISDVIDTNSADYVDAFYRDGKILYQQNLTGRTWDPIIAQATPEFPTEAQPEGFPIEPLTRSPR